MTFSEASGDLAATLDISAQDLLAQPLREVRFTAEQLIGARTAERALPVGAGNSTYTADRAWGADTLQMSVNVASD